MYSGIYEYNYYFSLHVLPHVFLNYPVLFVCTPCPVFFVSLSLHCTLKNLPVLLCKLHLTLFFYYYFPGDHFVDLCHVCRCNIILFIYSNILLFDCCKANQTSMIFSSDARFSNEKISSIFSIKLTFSLIKFKTLSQIVEYS